MPGNLPPVCELGIDKEWGCHEEPKAGSIVVPRARWAAMTLYLDKWAQYPKLCQGAIDDTHQIWRVILREEAKVEAARIAEQRLGEQATSWSRGKAYFGILIGAGVGLAAGFVLGVVVLAVD